MKGTYLICNFCSKSGQQVDSMFGGKRDSHICSHCIEYFMNEINESRGERARQAEAEVKKELDL